MEQYFSRLSISFLIVLAILICCGFSTTNKQRRSSTPSGEYKDTMVVERDWLRKNFIGYTPNSIIGFETKRIKYLATTLSGANDGFFLILQHKDNTWMQKVKRNITPEEAVNTSFIPMAQNQHLLVSMSRVKGNNTLTDFAVWNIGDKQLTMLFDMRELVNVKAEVKDDKTILLRQPSPTILNQGFSPRKFFSFQFKYDGKYYRFENGLIEFAEDEMGTSKSAIQINNQAVRYYLEGKLKLAKNELLNARLVYGDQSDIIENNLIIVESDIAELDAQRPTESLYVAEPFSDLKYTFFLGDFDSVIQQLTNRPKNTKLSREELLLLAFSYCQLGEYKKQFNLDKEIYKLPTSIRQQYYEEVSDITLRRDTNAYRHALKRLEQVAPDSLILANHKLMLLQSSGNPTLFDNYLNRVMSKIQPREPASERIFLYAYINAIKNNNAGSASLAMQNFIDAPKYDLRIVTEFYKVQSKYKGNQMVSGKEAEDLLDQLFPEDNSDYGKVEKKPEEKKPESRGGFIR